MSRRKTEDDYRIVAIDRGIEWVNNELPKNAYVKTGWRCQTNHQWFASYNSISQGSGCPSCSGNAPLTESDYRNVGADMGVEWIGSELPRNTRATTRWREKATGEVRETSYSKIKYRHVSFGNKKRIAKTEADYIKTGLRVGVAWAGSSLTLNTTVNTAWKCARGHRWLATYKNIRQGHACPQCAMPKGERQIALYLERLGVEFEIQKKFTACRAKRALPFDFYLPEFNTVIEYHGQQHYEPIEFFGGIEGFKSGQRRDAIKRDYCKKNGIRLIEMPYTELQNIDRFLADRLTFN